VIILLIYLIRSVMLFIVNPLKRRVIFSLLDVFYMKQSQVLYFHFILYIPLGYHPFIQNEVVNENLVQEVKYDEIVGNSTGLEGLCRKMLSRVCKYIVKKSYIKRNVFEVLLKLL
jgi:hypothetical protein